MAYFHKAQGIPCLTGLNPTALDPRHRQRGHERPQTSNFLLEIRILDLDAFRWTRLMVVKMMVRPIAKLSE
jgi:hypothetical protein